MGKTLFYKYYFSGLEKPIIMEAESKAESYDMLRQLSFKSQTPIDMKKLEDARIESPLTGISKRRREGKDYIWVGKEATSNGWLEKEEFDRINSLKNNNNGNNL